MNDITIFELTELYCRYGSKPRPVVGHFKDPHILKRLFYTLTIAFLLTACNQNSSTNAENKLTDTTNSANLLDKRKADKQEQVTKRITFKHISEIVADTSSYGVWVEKKDSNFSLALHFQYKDTLAISYSPECWIMYPYKVNGNRIVIYWDNNIDTKYDFDIVKAINKTDKKYIGKPFMILELKNDTTLSATYPLKELIKKINSSSKERTFFPDKFNVVQDGEVYD